MCTRRQFLSGAAVAGSTALAGCFGIFGADHAAYSTAGDTVDGVDYESVQSIAREAGYTVDGPYYVNAKREIGRELTVPALAEEFGTDARVVLTQFTYSATRFFEVDFTMSDGGVRLAFFDDALDFKQPFRPTNLPPDAWLAEQFALLFGLSGAAATGLVADVKSAAAGTSEHFLTYRVDRETDLTAVHETFTERATSVTTSATHGDGWATQTYADDSGAFGQFSVVVPSVRIATTDAGHEYVVKLDRLGGLWLLVTLDPGNTIPEDEYRGVFRRMFEAVGLPAERVAEYDFEYTPSNW